ncbi:MAG: hypothetical protein U0822_23535 [Anaerolineae bacterium]
MARIQPVEADIVVRRRTPWYAWPFVILWRTLAIVLNLIGRVTFFGVGMLLMIIGFFLTLTLLAAPVGIPLIILGFIMVSRAIF